MYDAKGIKLQKLGTDPNYRHEIVPGLVIIYAILHVCAVHGLYLVLTGRGMVLTILWCKWVFLLSEVIIVARNNRFN